MQSQRVNSGRARQMNPQMVLQTIRAKGPVSRKEISEITGLSPSAVSGITGAVIERGLVQEAGGAKADGRAGRKAIPLSLNPEAAYVVGGTLTQPSVSCVVTGLEANVLQYVECHCRPLTGMGRGIPVSSAEEVVRVTSEVVENPLAAADIDRARLLGTGVGINGIADAGLGVSILAPHFGWRNASIADRLAHQVGIPVYLENDARAGNIAQQWFGAGRGMDDIVTVAVDYGIGAGLVMNRRLDRGSVGGAGQHRWSYAFDAETLAAVRVQEEGTSA